MFSLTYILSELRRCRARTVLTALGLALLIGPFGQGSVTPLRPADALRHID